MNAPWLEVLSPGAQASLQDLGRRGHRRSGVPWSGALDPRLLRIANALAGNPEATCAIECLDGGQQFAAREGSLRLAIAGEAQLEILAGGEARALAPWRSFRLAPGEVLRIKGLARGRIAMLAVAGLSVAPVLGSASTYARAGLGGIDGRLLAAGSTLGPLPAPTGPERLLPAPPAAEAGAIRVVPGPQQDYFSAESLARFLAAEYRISPAADRMGVRLDGPTLSHADAAEIVSDATVPGAIQVPGNGQPIVLLADAQTAGGYPKIATVIGADLARLAQLRPGETLRFAAVDVATAEALARTREAETRALLASLRPLLEGGVDLEALYAANLVGGVVSGHEDD